MENKFTTLVVTTKRILITGAAVVLVGILLLSAISFVSASFKKGQRPLALREYIDATNRVNAAQKVQLQKECDLVRATLADYGNQSITLPANEVARLATRNTDCTVKMSPKK